MFLARGHVQPNTVYEMYSFSLFLENKKYGMYFVQFYIFLERAWRTKIWNVQFFYVLRQGMDWTTTNGMYSLSIFLQRA
jgi:hypothetical protein